jgi:hypothetical protein
MLTNASKDCIQMITAITYGIWTARNKKIFQEKDIPAIETVERALSALHMITNTISPLTASTPPGSNLRRAVTTPAGVLLPETV